jgi:hypothetical protein
MNFHISKRSLLQASLMLALVAPLSLRSREVIEQEELNLEHDFEKARNPITFNYLHNAAETGNLEIVQILVKNGANVLIKKDGKTPEERARENGHEAVADYLQAVTVGYQQGLSLCNLQYLMTGTSFEDPTYDQLDF